MKNYSFSVRAVKFLAASLIFSVFSLHNSLLCATELAITVDDLPIHGSLTSEVDQMRLLDLFLSAFDKHKITGVYGFINAIQLRSRPKAINILKGWLDGGHLLANHTFSHLDLEHPNVSVEIYINDIQKNEPILKKLMGKKNFHYFRYPYLEASTSFQKHTRVREFLIKEKYEVAQVTSDFSDWEWNHAYYRCFNKKNVDKLNWLKKTYIEEALRALKISELLSQHLFHRNVKHILLLHMGAFEGLMMDELLSQFQAHGVRFISLDEASQDEIYKLDPIIPFKRSDAFLTQIRLSRRVFLTPELTALYKQTNEGRVHAACRY